MNQVNKKTLQTVKTAEPFEILYTHFDTKIQVEDEEQVNKDMIKLKQIFNSLEAIKLAITFNPEDEFPKVEVTDVKLSE